MQTLLKIQLLSNLVIAISKAPLVEFNELRNNIFREIEF